jgi:hypothetical protein
MQLGMMNSMLRGLPMQNMSSQQYQATPSYLTQGLGAVGTLAGAYKAFGQKEGGIVGMREGGSVPGYAGPEGSVINSMRAKLEMMDTPQLQKIMQSSPSEEVRKLAAEIIMEHQMAAKAEQQVTPPTQAQAQSEGIAALPAPSMDNMAGGGIIAFAGPDGSQVEDPDLQYLNMAEKQQKAALERAGITGAPNAKYKEFIDKQISGLGADKESQKGLMMMDYFSNLGTQTGPLGYAALKAARETTPSFRTGLQSIKKAEADVMKSQAELQNADRLEALGLNKEANALRTNAENNKKALEVARINADAHLKAAGMSANRATDLDRDAQAYFNNLVKNHGMDAKDPATMSLARQKAREGANPYAQGNLDIKTEALIVNKEKEDKQLKSLGRDLEMADEDKKEAIRTQIATRKREIREEATASKPPKGNDGAPLPKAPDISTVTGAPAGSTIAAYVQGKGYEVRDKDGKLIGYAQGK